MMLIRRTIYSGNNHRITVAWEVYSYALWFIPALLLWLWWFFLSPEKPDFTPERLISIMPIWLKLPAYRINLKTGLQIPVRILHEIWFDNPGKKLSGSKRQPSTPAFCPAKTSISRSPIIRTVLFSIACFETKCSIASGAGFDGKGSSLVIASSNNDVSR